MADTPIVLLTEERIDNKILFEPGTAGTGSIQSKNGDCVASGNYSYAEGLRSKALGPGSHAEGSLTTASGNYSHAEGYSTSALTQYSHAEGSFTTTNNDFEHAEGQYNTSHTGTRHSVGIGTSESGRKNAIEIMENGDAYFYGVSGYDGTNPSSNNSLQKTIANINEIRKLSSSEIDYILGIEGVAIGAYIAALYIDDFEDGNGGNTYAEGWGYQSIEDYIQDVCYDISAATRVGTNIFVPTCDVMEYEGMEYRIWRGFLPNNNESWSTTDMYALAPLNLDYETLRDNSMEKNVDNRYSPFVAVFRGDYDPSSAEIEYTQNLGLKYRLICVKTLEYSDNPIESHSSAITRIYLDDFHDYGIYPIMYGNYGLNSDTMDDYIQAVRDRDNADQYWQYIGETMEYEGVEYKIYADYNTDIYGGLLPMDMTYQDLYPHTLECDGHNINTPYSPFVVRWIDGDVDGYEGQDPSDKYSTIIAID